MYITLHLDCSQAVESVQFDSPDRGITFDLQTDETGSLFYSVLSKGDTIIQRSKLGFNTNHGKLESFEIVSVKRLKVNQSWTPLYGERSEILDRYSAAKVKLQSHQDLDIILTLNCRAYNEGIAFRYEFPKQEKFQHLIIKNEHTEFCFTSDHDIWATYRAQSEYDKVPLSRVRAGCERPLVVEIKPDRILALGEAALVDYARMKFDPQPDKPYALVSGLAGSVRADLPFVSPWRYVMIGDNPGELLEHNYFILNLNGPNQIKDTSWIKPGKVIREVTLTTRGGKACVDFAVEHNLQFVEFDAGWYGHEYHDSSDATTISVDPRRSPGPLDLHEVIDYGKERDIGVILYVNRRALETQLDEILPLYQRWGIAGVKYGFVQVGSQQWTSWLHEAVRKAADHQLMVDVHDEYRPTGYSRTYPNLMTQEGIRGDEESPSNEHTLITLFTRMIAGAGDNTNCYFADRVEKMGSHVSQLAKAVCLYSPWQFLYWYDRPQGSPGKTGGAGKVENFITNEPELEFFDAVPTVWDETRVIECAIGEYAAIARRYGEEWFVGCINGPQNRTFEFKLDFLRADQTFLARMYSDDETMNTRTKIRIDCVDVTSGTTIREEISANQGLAMWIVPVERKRLGSEERICER